MNILFLGDIVGKIGRNTIAKYLPQLKHKYSLDFIIANGENTTHGKGLSLKHYKELTNLGINCITMGNHYLRVNEIISSNKEYINMVRPYNMNKAIPGIGSKLFTYNNKTIRVTNLLGRSFIQGADANPFDCLNDIVNSTKQDIHIVDFHAETTSEKLALFYAFKGKVSSIVGTHTHVQTNDDKIIDGTSYISDVGMNGAYYSILGVEASGVIERTWYGLNSRFEVTETGAGLLNGVILSFDNTTNKAIKIEKINIIDN